MLSWVFRFRARLQVVYGRVESPPLVGARFASRQESLPLPDRAQSGPARPGELRLRARGQVEIRPMPRRVA